MMPPIPIPIYETIDILLDVYAYHHAWRIAEQYSAFPKQGCYLLEMLKERRELNVGFVFAHHEENQAIYQQYGFSVIRNPREEEQLANYIMDLEAKVKNEKIIDFVRAVSPILYRLFYRLAKREVPNFETFIHDAKNAQYDTWLFHKMKQSDYPIFHQYLAIRRDDKITTKSLSELLQYSHLPYDIKEIIRELRQFERSVRNPLAHLIKPLTRRSYTALQISPHKISSIKSLRWQAMLASIMTVIISILIVLTNSLSKKCVRIMTGNNKKLGHLLKWQQDVS